MSAVVIGSGLGVAGSSAALLGGRGALGGASFGKDGTQVSVNAATGNLVIQRRDELVIGTGNGIGLMRTYNSQGVLDGDNNDNWRLSLVQSVSLVSGTLGAAGSTAKRVAADGTEFTYTWNAAKVAYVCNEGGAEEDRLTFTGSAATLAWTWLDGASQTKQNYNSAGQLTQVAVHPGEAAADEIGALRQEASRLTTPGLVERVDLGGLGDADHIFAIESGRNDMMLDGCRMLKMLLDGRQKLGRNAQIAE